MSGSAKKKKNFLGVTAKNTEGIGIDTGSVDNIVHYLIKYAGGL